jgi:hypothetical protein
LRLEKPGLPRHLHRHQAGYLLQRDRRFEIIASGKRLLRELNGTADSRVPGEGYLGSGEKYPHLCGMARIIRRLHEDRLGEVEFARDGLHLHGREAIGILDDRKRIACEALRREHIDSVEA